MNGTSAGLLVTAAAVAALGAAALVHRRDSLGAFAGVALLLAAVTSALVGFAATAPTTVAAAQLQAAAVVVEVLSAVTLPGAVAVALVLRRRTGSDLLELAAPRTADQNPAGPQIELPAADAEPTLPPEEPRDELEPGS
jgi:NADH:ubiquinone oxidoreductase subunit K